MTLCCGSVHHIRIETETLITHFILFDMEKEKVFHYLSMALPYKPTVRCMSDEEIHTVIGMQTDGYLLVDGSFNKRVHISECIPILKPLSRITDEDRRYIVNAYNGNIIDNGDNSIIVINYDYNSLKLYLKGHYDFMGLIDDGLAECETA